MTVLVYLGSLNKIPDTGWAYKKLKFISHSFGSRKFRIKLPAWLGVGPLLVPSYSGKGKKALGALSISHKTADAIREAKASLK